jgi:hypothetical protein
MVALDDASNNNILSIDANSGNGIPPFVVLVLMCSPAK